MGRPVARGGSGGGLGEGGVGWGRGWGGGGFSESRKVGSLDPLYFYCTCLLAMLYCANISKSARSAGYTVKCLRC